MLKAELVLPDSTIWRIAEYAAAHGCGFDTALALAVMVSPLEVRPC